jgi:hypothetical protein
MARQKKYRVPDEEIEDSGVKKDFFSDQRASSGFIKIRLSDSGASLMARSTEREIENRQKELEVLRERQRKLDKIEEKLEKKSKKGGKKEKKKNKKDKKKLKSLPESSRILFGAIEEYKEKYHKSKKDKKKEQKEFDGISSRAKGGSNTKANEEEEKKRKEEREKKEFEKKFEEPITLLRQTVLEVDKTLEEIDKLIAETKESRARNRGIMLKDLFSAKSSLFGNRTVNARAIGDLQKVKLEMDVKRLKETAATGNEKNQNISLLARAFPHLVANAGKLLTSDDDNSGKKDKDKDKDRDKDKKKKRSRDRGDDEGKFLERASRLLRDGDLELTPHEASIDMEGKYQVVVKKSFKNHEWEFTALDQNGKEIRNFKEKHPGLLPKKKHHDLRFDDNADVAKCQKTDRVFQVIPVGYL